MRRSLAIPCEQADYVEFYCRKGPVVGRILGKACEKHQETLKEDPREVYTLRFDELDTVLVEIEAVINSRLLTYMYDDEESLSYPSDLIYTLRFDLIYSRQITSTPNSKIS